MNIANVKIDRGLNKFINNSVEFFFQIRLIIIIAFLVGLFFIGKRIWFSSTQDKKLTNAVLVLTAGSVIIGICYSILNYEYNHVKFKHDIKCSQETLSFNVALEWHRPDIVNHLRVSKTMYDTHKGLLNNGRAEEFSQMLEKDMEARAALISIFNYFECVSIGVEHGVMDKEFIKKFFKSIFIQYHQEYDFYIAYRRKSASARAWINFTNLAQEWINEK